jgi:hypothetical protein
VSNLLRFAAFSIAASCVASAWWVSTPAPSAAEPSSTLARFAGTYRYVGGEAEIEALDRAIEEVVQKMNFLIRGIARRRLRAPNLPSSEVGIFVERGQIRITRPGRPEVSAPADGRPINWRHPDDGDVFRVSHGVDDRGVLYQRFEDDRSLSLNHFTLSDDGRRLTIETKVTADRLPAPLSFKTTYERAGPEGDG